MPYKLRKYTSWMIDLAILLAIPAFLFFLFRNFDVFEWFYKFSRTHEDWELDEVFLLILGGMLSATILAIKHSIALMLATKDLAKTKKTLLETQKQKTQSERLASIGQLAAGMAHEINNALQPTIGMTEVLNNRLKDNDPKTRELVSMVHESALQARNIIEHVLYFARCNSMHMHFSPLDDTLEQCLKSILPGLPDGIELTADIANILNHEPRPYLYLNEGALEKALTNIVNNAIEAMDENGSIIIKSDFSHQNETDPSDSALVPGEYVEIDVIDKGRGMNEDFAKKVFEPFVSTKPQKHGTGLGLATAYGIIRQFGGTIRVNSLLGKGSCFKVMLPVLEESDRKNFETEIMKEALV